MQKSMKFMGGKPMRKLLSVLIVGSFLVCAVQAQILNVGDDTAGPMPGGHSHIHLLSETVNPANGSVNLNITLPTAKGRGITLPFALTYNSGQVHHFVSQGPFYGIALIPDNSPQVGGWANSLPVLSLGTFSFTSQPPKNPTYTPPAETCNYTTGYMFEGHALYLFGIQNPSPTTEANYDFNCANPIGGPSYSLSSKGGDREFYGVFPSNCSNDNAACAVNGTDPVNVYDRAGTVYSFTPKNPIFPFSTGATLNGAGNTESFQYPGMFYWPTSVEDRNGNTIRFTANSYGGVTVTDTLGRMAINTNDNAAPTTVVVGGLLYAIAYTTVRAQYRVGVQQVFPYLGSPQTSCGVQPVVNDTQRVIQTITLPNQTQFYFHYGTDTSDPNFQNPYGLLNEIDYPGGGSVKYKWKLSDTLSEFIQFDGTAASNPNDVLANLCTFQYNTPVVAMREVSYDGSSVALIQTFTYSTTWDSNSGGASWDQKTTKVTSTDQVTGKSALTVYTYDSVQAPSQPNMCCAAAAQIPVEHSVQYYDWGNTAAPIRTVNKTWADLYTMTSQQTVLENGQGAQAIYSYVNGGQLHETDEYDFGQSTPSRKTILNYQPYSSGPLAVFSEDVCQKIVTDGSGNHVAETDYFYDGGAALCLAAGAPPLTGVNVVSGTHDEANYGPGGTIPRGNLTQQTAKCSTGSTACAQGDSNTNYAYDETGQVLTATDARNNVTTYSYADSFVEGSPQGATNAYLTKVTDALNHTEQYQYGYDDGLLRTSTDENGNQSCYLYNDSLLRLTENDHYSGSAQYSGGLQNASCSGTLLGQATLSYNDSAPSPSVTTNQAINAITNKTTVATMDGMGHVVKTQTAVPMTSCSSGYAFVSTTYDGLGRQASISNPYCSTSDPTYGVTTPQYDALGRATKVTRQDGSAVLTSYSGPCTTVTDEVGNPRRSCVDGLGRLIEVDEPGNPYSGAQASGALAITGALLSQSRIGATNAGSATASLTIGCANYNCQDQSKVFYVGAQNYPTTIYDQGTVTVQLVNTATGQTLCTSGSQGYGSASSPNSVATAVAGPLAYNCGSYLMSVTVPPGSNVINFVAQPGTAGNNYRLQNSSTWMTQGPYGQPAFSSASFYATPSTVQFANGTPANPGTTVYDSGTVVVTMGSFSGSAPYSQSGNSTSDLVARALVDPNNPNNLNRAGSNVSVSYQGNSTLLITYKQIGTAGDVNVAAVSNSGSSQYFPHGSFSGATQLQNGQNPEGPSLDHNYYVTLYKYDVLGNLLCVEQHGGSATGTGCSSYPTPTANDQWRPRMFTYDSLSQLLTAYNPETGLTTFFYDRNSNLLQKVMPTPNQTGTSQHTVSYCYDALNRVTGKAYSWQNCQSNGQLPAGAAVVTYAYDQGTNSIGYLTSLADQAGSASYGYDALGRITAEQRTIAGIQKSLSYTYNLDNSVATLTYPSGNILTYTPDSAGRTLSAVDNGHGIHYVTNATYGPDNSLIGFVSGNTITSSFSYNKRLQPLNMSASSQQSAVFSLNYDFHLGNGDNGNVFGITNNRDNTRSQTFAYDPLNRLASALTLNWSQNYGYDSWGNLLQKNVAGGDTSLGVVVNGKNQVTNWCYDAAGNVTGPNPCSSYANNVFPGVYDAENRLTQVTVGGILSAYNYDADGQRVKKITNGIGTLYWYGPGGEVLEETDLGGTLKNDYVFFDGKRVARYSAANGYAYYFADHLGSADVVTDSNGNIKEESDYYPFGGERVVTDTGIGNNYKFTGKERDSETGVDYFGARYYSSSMGRFLSADPSGLYYANPTNPQSLNLYPYSRNNPLINIDPTGLDCIYINNDTGQMEGFNTGDCDNSTEDRANSGYYVDDHVNEITFDQQGQVTGYSADNSDGMFDSFPGSMNPGETVATLNLYGNKVSAPGTSINVFGASEPIDLAAMDFYRQHANDHWIGPLRPRTPLDQRGDPSCYLAPDAVSDIHALARGQYENPPQASTDGPYGQGIHQNTTKGNKVFGNEAADTKFNAAFLGMDYAVSVGNCLQGH